MEKRIGVRFAVLNVLFFAAQAGWSQEARGTIVGRVVDASGAAIPNASVVVSNNAMGTKTSVPTNGEGFYQATYLIPGAYQVIVEAPGFKRSVRDGVDVRINDRLAVDVKLEVGTAEQSITVTEEVALLSTASASMGSVVDGRRITELPMAHGNPYALIGLASGVAFARDPKLDRPFEPTHIVGYQMDGTRANRSDVTIDGAPSTATANAGEVISTYVPPADIVQEFKVQTATFDASFGQTEGGVTNIGIKSGTNRIHGSGYYDKFVPGMFANDFFANATRTPRPDFKYDRWGGSFGGPVVLPKIYDGHNKTFFMWGYEGIHESRPRNNGTPSVPTVKMKNGDFSELVGANYQVYNPFTRRSIGGGRYQQDPFPGNLIPANLINGVSKNILKFFPDPKSEGNSADKSNNYQRPELQEQAKYYSMTVRGDHNISDKQRLFARVSWYDRNSTYNNFFDNLATGSLFQFISRSGVVDDVYMLNPTTVLNVRYGYNRFIRADAMNAEANGFDLASLGFPTAYANAIPAHLKRFPRIEMTGYQGTGFGADYRPIDTHSINATLQKVWSAHSLKWGMEFRSYRENSVPVGNDQTGRFNFDGGWSKGPLDNSPAAPGSRGQSVADFLLGLPSFTNSLVARNASYAEQSTSWGFFFHDDWKVNAKLTLNLGLRWEFETPLTERFDRSVRGLDFSLVQPFQAQAQTNYARNPTPEVGQLRTTGGLTFAGANGLPRGLYETPKVNLMPRVGFAYQLDPKTVVRGGYGIFFGFLGQRRGDVSLHGFSRATPQIATTDQGLTFPATLSNPFPGGILEPLGSSQGGLTFVGQGVTVFNQNPVMPYMQRWQLGLQREIAGGFLVEASYVGNRGTNIEISRNINVTPQQYLSRSPVRDNAAIAYLSANLPNPLAGLLPAGAIGGLTGTNIPRERLLRPYPHFDAVNFTSYDGYSWYHSAQLRLERRFSKGFTLGANYTFSKFMQATELMAQDDPRPQEMISDQDYPHRFTFSAIWELPFGKGRPWLNSLHPVGNAVLGGWQIAGIQTIQSGQALAFPTNTSVIFNGKFRDIPLGSDQQSTARWFNTAAGFELNSAAQLDLGRQIRTFPIRFGYLRQDRVHNYDLSLLKKTFIGESKYAEFKFDFLNAMNSTWLPAPNMNPSQPAFGTIVASRASNYPRRIQFGVRFVF